MAQRVTVELVDDLDGTASDTVDTVSFSLDGVDYEIDLAEDNAEKLRASVSDFVAAARRVSGRAKRGAGQKRTGPVQQSREHNQAIREWARLNGWNMSERGRIPAGAIEAYEAAQTDTAPAAETKPGTKAKVRARARKEPAFSS